MNLHSVGFPLRNVAIWLTASGRNGRNIGTHLWPIEEGEPIPFDVSRRPSYYSRDRYTPPRFSWQPFNFRGLFGDGYTPPLCGRRSASTSPRVDVGWDAGCPDCASRARASGIVPLTYDTALRQSSLPRKLTIEHQAWVDAGRPDEWPLAEQN